jgi:uncharacterized protein YjbI with pentapeptide repeats
MPNLKLRSLLFWLATISAIALPHVGAFACSCAMSVDPAEFLRRADLVFEGKVTSIQEADRIQKAVTLQVTSPLKGKLGPTVTLDQEREGMCAEQFKANEEVWVVAYDDAVRGHSSDTCSNYFIQWDDRSSDIQMLALKNRARTAALMGSDRLPPNETQSRLLLHWLSEYRALEEGLDAVDGLLNLVPGDREARLFRAEFLSELNRDAEALMISQVLLAKNPADDEAQRRRVFSLARLKRSGDIPGGWRDFVGLRASDVDFHRKRMPGALFLDAELFNADFSDAAMAVADLSRATFYSANFSRTDLSEARLLETSMYFGSDLTDADLRGAIIANARLDGITLTGADARGAILAGSSVEGDLSGVDMRGTDLRGAYFGAATDWTGAKLQNADLRNAHVDGSTIAKADLTGAVYNDKTIFPVDFDPTAAGAIHVQE